jgi:1,4-dihydroxy-2-naphthoate octaprenyltransferase
MTDEVSAGAGPSRGAWLAVRLRALRAFSLPVSVLPPIIAVAAVEPMSEWRWDVLAACVVGAALLHAAGNLFNDYFDFRFGLDQVDDGRPGLVIARKEMTPSQVLAEGVVFLGAAAPIAAYLVWRCGPGVLAFAAVGASGLYAYTGPPFRLKYVALGEPVIFIVFGPTLMLGAAYAQTGRVEPLALLMSVPIGFATAAILLGNNIRDREEDRGLGIRTLASFAGGRLARAVYLLLILGCVGGLATCGALGLAPRLLMLAPLALVLIRRELATVWRGGGWGDLATRTAQFETLVLAGVLLATVIQAALK